jgi:hypothetical protein
VTLHKTRGCAFCQCHKVDTMSIEVTSPAWTGNMLVYHLAHTIKYYPSAGFVRLTIASKFHLAGLRRRRGESCPNMQGRAFNVGSSSAIKQCMHNSVRGCLLFVVSETTPTCPILKCCVLKFYVNVPRPPAQIVPVHVMHG